MSSNIEADQRDANREEGIVRLMMGPYNHLISQAALPAARAGSTHKRINCVKMETKLDWTGN